LKLQRGFLLELFSFGRLRNRRRLHQGAASGVGGSRHNGLLSKRGLVEVQMIARLPAAAPDTPASKNQ